MGKNSLAAIGGYWRNPIKVKKFPLAAIVTVGACTSSSGCVNDEAWFFDEKMILRQITKNPCVNEKTWFFDEKNVIDRGVSTTEGG
jgi:hypothetical protein